VSQPRSAAAVAAVLLWTFAALSEALVAAEECQYHRIEEYLLPKAFTCIEVGPNDVVYGWFGHALWTSADRGETWESHSCDDPADNSRMWKMDECSSGNLYVGEYGGAWADTCAYVYKSIDGGDTWETVYACSSRHVHFVSVDPYTGRLYASIGDGPGRYRLIASDDGGASWNILYEEDCLAQPISIAFTPTHRILGSDCGGWTRNRVYATADDHTFETRLLLAGEHDSYVWDMSTNSDGYIFAGTKAKLPEGSVVCLYASYDGGTNWCTLKDFGLLPEWSGVNDISRFDSAGWAYYTVSTAPAQFHAFRFRDEQVSSVSEAAAGSRTCVRLTVNGSDDATVAFELPPSDGPAAVRIYNARGQCVRTLAACLEPGGSYELVWDGLSDSGRRVSSGVYFVTLTGGDVARRAKLVVLR